MVQPYRIPLLIIALSMAVIGCTPQSSQSISWENQIIYFLLTDRFADGDPRNNDQGAGEYDTTREATFHGGDFAGIRQHIPYLQELGITTVWLTPPVRNQWWNPDTSFTGYHGYWASHFMQTDPHYGSLSEYQQLADELHRNEMYLIQDVVVNHTADFFSYRGHYDPTQPEAITRYADAPTQAPFDRNDPRNPTHRRDSIYHWTPSVSDFQDQQQKHTFQMADLDDLNTSHPQVREALLASFQFWIREVGVDGFRFDTPLYVEHPFWRAFLYEGQGDMTGIEPYAAQQGKPDFYTFGETWVNAPAYSPEGDQRAARYLGTATKPEMDGILNFPLQQTIQAVFAGGQPTDQLTYRLHSQEDYFPRPTQRLNFIDNHDMPRFRTQASEAATRQALFFILSIPGVPVIYQGTEQGDLETRPNLFGRLNTQTESFQFIKELIRMRRQHPATRHGKLTVLADDSNLPGLFVYSLETDEERLIVALNTNDYPLLATHIPVAGSNPQTIYTGNGEQSFQQYGQDFMQFSLSAKGILVLQLSPGTNPTPGKEEAPPPPAMDSMLQSTSLTLSLPFTGADSSFLLIDGRLDQKVPVQCGANNCTADILLANLAPGKHRIQRLAYTPDGLSVSDTQAFQVTFPTQPVGFAADPVGDDRGPTGTYQYPTHATFDRPNDLKEVTVEAQGHNLQVTITMGQPLSTVWNPPNGFDHLHLSLFIDVPGRQGTATLPERGASMPAGAAWDVHLQANGWTTQVHTAQGATATNPGTALTVKPRVTADAEQGTIALAIPAAMLGDPASIEGIQFYLTTWDSAGEGGLRPLSPTAASFTYGGAPKDSPRIMDALWIPWEK